MSFYLFDFSRDAGGEKKHFAVPWPTLEPATLHESAADDVFVCRVVSFVRSAALLHACPHGLPDDVYVLHVGKYSELMSWLTQATPLPDGDGDGVDEGTLCRPRDQRHTETVVDSPDARAGVSVSSV